MRVSIRAGVYRIHVHTRVHMYTWLYVHVSMSPRVCVSTPSCMCVSMHVCIYIYIYIYMSMCLCVYAHIYASMFYLGVGTLLFCSEERVNPIKLSFRSCFEHFALILTYTILHYIILYHIDVLLLLLYIIVLYIYIYIYIHIIDGNMYNLPVVPCGSRSQLQLLREWVVW